MAVDAATRSIPELRHILADGQPAIRASMTKRVSTGESDVGLGKSPLRAKKLIVKLNRLKSGCQGYVRHRELLRFAWINYLVF